MRVVCIDDNWTWYSHGRLPVSRPKKGEIYTVFDAIVDEVGDLIYAFEEFGFQYWLATKFRPVEENFGEAICTAIEKEINEPELV